PLAASAAAACVVAYQYTTRRTGRSIALALLGSLVALAAADLWAWPFLKAPEVPLPAELDPAAVRLVPDPGKTLVADAGSMRSSRAPRKHVTVRLEAAGLPPGVTVRPIGIRSRFELPGGVVLEATRALELGAPYEENHRETSAAL